MISRRWAVWALCTSALCLAPSSSRAGFVDPTGDTFNGPSNLLDITTYDGTFAGGVTTFTVNFAAAFAKPSAFAANSLSGFIDIDQDQNAATGGNAAWGANQPGGNSWINFTVAGGGAPGPAIALGDEFFVDLGSEAFHANQVDIVSAATNAVSFTVPIVFTATSFSLVVPFIGTGAGGGAMNFGLLVGNPNVATDRAANGATGDATTNAAAGVPEPSTLALSGIAGLAGLAIWRKRRAKPAA